MMALLAHATNALFDILFSAKATGHVIAFILPCRQHYKHSSTLKNLHRFFMLSFQGCSAESSSSNNARQQADSHNMKGA